MSNYQIKIKLLSDTLIGSGEGYGAIIDTDIIHDDFGLPYIPGKRIKGVLLESAEMLNSMFEKLNYSIPINEIFGKTGQISGQLQINNLYIENYNEIVKWLKYLKSRTPLINKQRILNQLTSIRYSTAIDEKTGIAKEHSLRSERVINKGIIFWGDIEIEPKDEQHVALMCKNIRRIGTKRNRGLGKVKIDFFRDSHNLCEVVLEKLKTENVL